MLFGVKMVLCALAGLSASLRSAANLPAAAHKNFIFAPHNIIYYYCYVGKVKSTSANFPKAERHYSQSP
jgi:hypothetical protein